MTRRLRRVTILMAEDDPDYRLLMKRAFEQALPNQDLQFVGNGEELMDYLKRRDKYADPASSPWPALVLLDLNMPRKDGWEALREIQADPRLRQLRAIVLTTSEAEQDVALAYEASAASYIVKPASFADLVGVVEALGRYWLGIVRLPGGGAD